MVWMQIGFADIKIGGARNLDAKGSVGNLSRCHTAAYPTDTNGISITAFQMWYFDWLVDCYDSHIPPIGGTNATVPIGILLKTEHIVPTDVVNHISMLVRLTLTWYDDRLAFDSDSIDGWQDGHNYIVLPTTYVGVTPSAWVPYLVPLNHIMENTDESFTNNSNVRIYSSNFAEVYGYNVYWERSLPIRFLCQSLYPATFPSDMLMCFLDWGHNIHTARNYLLYDLGDSDYEMVACPLYNDVLQGVIIMPQSDEHNILVRFVFTFRRKSLFYVMFIMEPFLCIVFLISISFWYPVYWVDRVAFIIPLLISMMNVGGIVSDYSVFVAQPVDARTAWVDLTTIISTLVLLPAAESALINSVFLLIQRHNLSAIRLFEIHQKANMKVWLEDLNNFISHIKGVPLKSESSLEFKAAPIKLNLSSLAFKANIHSTVTAEDDTSTGQGVQRIIQLLGYSEDTIHPEKEYPFQLVHIQSSAFRCSDDEQNTASEHATSGSNRLRSEGGGFLTMKQNYLSRVTEEQEKLLKEKACVKAKTNRNFVARATLLRLLTSSNTHSGLTPPSNKINTIESTQSHRVDLRSLLTPANLGSSVDRFYADSFPRLQSNNNVSPLVNISPQRILTLISDSQKMNDSKGNRTPGSAERRLASIRHALSSPPAVENSSTEHIKRPASLREPKLNENRTLKPSGSDIANIWADDANNSFNKILSLVANEQISTDSPKNEGLYNTIDNTMLIALKQYSSQLMRARPNIYSIYNVIELSSFIMRMLLPPLVLAIWFKVLDPIFYSELSTYHATKGQTEIGELTSVIFGIGTNTSLHKRSFASNILVLMIYCLCIAYTVSTVVYARWWIDTLVKSNEHE